MSEQLIVKTELLQAVVNFLATCPYQQVHQLIVALQQSIPFVEQPKQPDQPPDKLLKSVDAQPRK